MFTVKNLPCRCVDLECCQCTLFRRKKIVKLRSSGPTKKRRGAAALPLVERPLGSLVGHCPSCSTWNLQLGVSGLNHQSNVPFFSDFLGGESRMGHFHESFVKWIWGNESFLSSWNFFGVWGFHVVLK